LTYRFLRPGGSKGENDPASLKAKLCVREKGEGIRKKTLTGGDFTGDVDRLRGGILNIDSRES